MDYRAEILALPEDDRLPAALDMIGDLMGGGTADRAHWANALGVSPAVAAVFLRLYATPDKPVPHDAISMALEFIGYEGSTGTVRSYVFRINKRLRPALSGRAVSCVHGLGYRMTREAAEYAETLSPRHRPPRPTIGDMDGAGRKRLRWCRDEDARLRAMAEDGADLIAVSAALGRSPRGVSDRASALGVSLT